MNVYQLWWQLLKQILWLHGKDEVYVDTDRANPRDEKVIDVYHPDRRDDFIVLLTDYDAPTTLAARKDRKQPCSREFETGGIVALLECGGAAIRTACYFTWKSIGGSRDRNH